MAGIDYADAGCGRPIGRVGSRGHHAPVPRLTGEVRALLRQQRGVIADWQAAALGIERRALRRACGSGWMQVSPHVFADREGDLSTSQLRVAGALECGPSALLAGRSALAEAGWRADDERLIDVIAPRGARHRSAPRPRWLRVHYPEAEARGRGSPARTGTARACIDAAAWARTPGEVLFLLTSAAQQRLVTPDAVRAEFESRSRVRNAPLIRDTLDSMALGVTTTGEARFLRECRRRGLPQPRMQVAKRAQGRRRRVVDAEFRTGDGRVVIVEIDGAGHLDVDTWHDDMTRQNGLVMRGDAIVLRVSNWQVAHDPEPFFALLGSLVAPA